MQKITPFLWFDGKAEEAVNSYVSVFRNSRIVTATRYGVSWQIVPGVLGSLLQGPDGARSGRAMQALLQMTKLDIARLKQAYEQN